MGFFGTDSVDDAVLGRLVRKGGCWRGSVNLGAPVPLAIAGSRHARSRSTRTGAPRRGGLRRRPVI